MKHEAVAPEDLMRMANDMLENAKLSLAVIGPAKDDKDIGKVLSIR